MIVTLPPVVQRPTKNYSATPINHNLIICHRTEGDYAGSVAWLCNPSAEASSHLVMKADGSEVSQLVPLQYKAWAQCAFNSAGVSLEIEGFTAQGMAPETVKAAAAVVAWLCAAYNIPPLWAKGGQGRGICQHHDLGAAGGGHVDCFGVGSAEWQGFLDAVMDVYKALPSPLPAFALHGAPGPHEIVPPPAVTPEASHGGAARIDPAPPVAAAVAPPPGLNEDAWNLWLQSWLNAHGSKLEADGDLGPVTRDALAAYLVKHA